MKKLVLFIILIAASILCFAGIDEFYTFNATTGTYTAITGTPISDILNDDLLSAPIDIGFTFPYGEGSFTQLKVSSNGWIGLGTSLTGSNLSNELISSSWFPVLAPLWDDTSLAGGSAEYLLTGTAPNRILTIQYSNLFWNYSGTTTYNLQVQMQENGKITFVYGTNTGAPNSPSASIGINMSPGGANWFYSVSPGAVPTVSQTTENNTISAFPDAGTKYEFIPVVAAQNDLACIGLTGNTTPSVGNATVYTVTVRNRGSLPQSTYQVKLVTSTGTELASVNGTTIQPGSVLSFPLSWTPSTQGPLILRGKVVLTGDQNPNNDQSNPLNITVMPPGMVVVTIGDGTEQARLPVDMYWKNSLFETLYYPNEIGMVGNITALSFYNNFVTNLSNMPTKIWLGTTQQADLSAGWIPSTQLNLVFDGTVNYPSGANTILIPLQTVFTYTTGNLVMLVNRPMDTQYYSSLDNFYCQTVGSTRSRYIYSDGTLFDPAAPPADAANIGQFPKTSIHLTPLGTDPVAMINPSSVSFGQVLMNSNNTRTVSVMNGGGGTLTINSVALTGNAFITLTNPPATPINLTTGQSLTLNLSYVPTAAGDHSATLAITDNLTRTVHNVPITASCIDPTIYSLPYAQNFDDVTAPALPLTWQKIQQSTSTGAAVRTIASDSFSQPNSVYFYNEGDMSSNLLLISPLFSQTLQMNNSKVHFRAKSSSTTATLLVGIMTNPQDATTFTQVQSVNITNTWTEYVVNFSSYTGAGHYVAFKHGNTATWQSLYLDNVSFAVIPVNDLAALSLTGNVTPSSGNATTYTATLYNWGSATQTAYTVKLYNAANVELATATGVSVATDQTVQVPIIWTPTTEGPTQIYAKVILTGDQNNLNDNTPMLSITVMPAGLLVASIGTGTELGRIPIDMFYRNSLFETMYYPTEIGAFGNITALAFYNNFATNLPNKPTKIWLGTTQQADLSAGWIPSTQLTLVYDGTLNYPNGQNTIMIPLQTPFTYAGGNLVLMANRPMDTTYFSSLDRFYYSNCPEPRSLNVFSDWDDFQPANPPATATTQNLYPNVSLYMTPLGPDPIFSINPSSRNFGTVLLNSIHNQTFTIMNAGGSPLTINTINIAGSPFFSLQNMPALPASLNTGQSITFVGRYNPTAAGTHTATITINDHLRIALGSRNSSNRTPHNVELSGTCVDPTIMSLPYLQNFDAVTAPALPVQWTTIVQGTSQATITTTTSGPLSPPNCVRFYNGPDDTATLILVAPPYANTINTNTTRVNFKAKAGGTYPLIVGIMTDPQNPLSFTEIQSVTLSNTWTEYVVTFGAYTGAGRVVAFKHAQTGTYQDVYLDDVMLEVIPQNDLAALSITGNSTPTLGVAATYTVNVFNWGSLAQNTYQVKLFKQGNIEIASSPGVAIGANQTVPVTVTWTPDAEGPVTIYGKVVLANDQNSLNDQCPSITVTVQPPGLLVYTIGDGSSTGRIPLDMYYMNSLYECIYYPAELSNTIGSIYGIGFYNNFVTELSNMPTNIWIGTTTQADLSDGWIPSTQLTQVFSGNVNYPTGENLINISFPTPYLYLNGQNLVVMVERPMDTQYYSSSDVFKTQSLTQSRARNIYSDGTDYDPANPPTGGSASTAFPKTSFFIIPGGVGHLNGTILGAGNQALQGVAISSTTGGYSATTNAQGQFSIINIIAGTYTFNFTHHGYIDHSVQIVIPEDQTIVHNYTMQQMPMVTVSGTILGSDTGTGLSGAGIYLTGYDDYTSTSNAQGLFSIPSVYANFSYDYTIICPGYQNHAGTIMVGSTNYSFGNITLSEVAYAPRQVNGEIVENNTQVSLSWLPPDPTALDVLESFEGTTFPPTSWEQVIHNNGAPVSGVYPTWCRFGNVTINGQTVSPTDGVMQAGLWWSYEHQDEWLITPSFNCPPSAYLTFDSYVFLGSSNGDHYYVKISTDNGNTWTVIWDASAQTGGWNYYASPITLDLSMYQGLQLKIAWEADDPPTDDGMWYVWFIDDIYIGNAVASVNFTADQLTRISGLNSANHFTPIRNPLEASLSNSKAPVPGIVTRNVNFDLHSTPQTGRASERALIGYKVWRLTSGQESDPGNWTLLTPELLVANSFIDQNWATLPNGNYRWAVKAVYTSNVLSVPSLSNVLVKQLITGYISGVVRNANTNAPIQGATITAASYTATTNSVGAYSILLPIGVYNVSASAPNYQTQTTQNVSVNANQTTTVNFLLPLGSGTEDPELPVAITELKGNYPNPFNPETTISFSVKEPGWVSLQIFNLKGQLIRNLAQSEMPSGHYRLLWNGRDELGRSVGSGIYYYRLKTGAYQSTKKMLLME
jgi:hypothetical protein